MRASTGFNWCFLSPHLDDAIFSCGGQIHQAKAKGESVNVVSVFTADEPSAERLTYDAKCLHLAWGLRDNVYAQRRREDQAACETLSAAWYHLGFSDCIYRRDQDTGSALYDLNAVMAGEIKSPDAALLCKIIEAFRRLPQSQHVLAPIAIHTGHVDHLLVRIAAELVFRQKGVLLYYEDLPYACGVDLDSRLSQFNQWESQVHKLSEQDIEAKLLAVDAYTSQLFDVFRGQRPGEILASYANRIGGERIWRKKRIDWYQAISAECT
ncbi:MAG: PIG-L family deacetylase [Oligoflexia bacterium]|nr:PIG-L family deacetylase [Oligoflexia bacterium]